MDARSNSWLMKKDLNLLEDSTRPSNESNLNSDCGISKTLLNVKVHSQLKMPPYPFCEYSSCNTDENNSDKTYLASDLKTPSILAQKRNKIAFKESQQTLLRRHTVVGCQSNAKEINVEDKIDPSLVENSNNCNSAIKPAPQLFYTESNTNISSSSISSSPGDMSGVSVRRRDNCEEFSGIPYTLTLEEIVHIRTVITKAEFESLPDDVGVKEDVKRQKICFLCLRTRFSVFGPKRTQCKICQHIVCTKCFTRMRFSSQNFCVGVEELILPSVLSTPRSSSVVEENISNENISFESPAKSESKATISPRRPQFSKVSSSEHIYSNITYIPKLEVSSKTSHFGKNKISNIGSLSYTFLPSKGLYSSKKETSRNEILPVCHDCKALLLDVVFSTKRTRSSIRNRAIRNLTLDLSPVYK